MIFYVKFGLERFMRNAPQGLESSDKGYILFISASFL